MKKNVLGRKLKRTTNQRKGLFRSLIRSIILEERIKTTEAKAKAVRPQLEKLITRARNEKENGRRELLKAIPQPEIVDRLIAEIAPRFDSRAGGYTRIIRLGGRVKDNAQMVYLELVERGTTLAQARTEKRSSKSAKKETKSVEAAKELPAPKKEKKSVRQAQDKTEKESTEKKAKKEKTTK